MSRRLAHAFPAQTFRFSQIVRYLLAKIRIRQTGIHFRMFVTGVVVNEQVKMQFRRSLRVNLLQKSSAIGDVDADAGSCIP